MDKADAPSYGRSMAMWTDNGITKSAVEQFCARYPQYQVVEREVWPRYSGSIEMAWRVVERMRKNGFHFSLIDPCPGCGWTVELYGPSDALIPGGGHIAIAETAPEAICACALRAVGCEVPG